MISRYCKLCLKLIDNSFINAHKYRTKVNYQNKIHNRKTGRNENSVKVMEDRIPILICKRKEFNFYVGDTFSKYEPVLATKGWNHPKSKGDYFTIYPINEFSKTEEEEEDKLVTFKTMNLSKEVIQNLNKYGYERPTNIQVKAFPSIINGHNTVIAAETGSGKTMAYLLPLIEQIFQYKTQVQRRTNEPLGLILTPSRELAVQITRETKKLTNGLDIKTKVIIGGRTKKIMRNPPVDFVDILIGTIGVTSKLVSNRLYKLKYIQHVILDEADSLLDETFEHKLIPFLHKIKFCFSRTNSENGAIGAQLTLSSATMPSNISETLGEFVDIDSLSSVTTNKLHQVHVPQKFIRLGKGQKPMILLKLIKQKVRNKHTVIIFTNKSDTCDWLTKFLKEFGVDNIHLNGSMSVNTRRGKFADFQSGRVNVLCATDAGSRGLDTITTKEVINYDFPLQTAEYIHRCGRTGRVGSPKECRVVNFISQPLEIELARKLEVSARKMKPIPIVNMLLKSSVAEYNSLIETLENVNHEEEILFEDVQEDPNTPF